MRSCANTDVSLLSGARQTVWQHNAAVRGSLLLAVAQRTIASNWWVAYGSYVVGDAPSAAAPAPVPPAAHELVRSSPPGSVLPPRRCSRVLPLTFRWVAEFFQHSREAVDL
jgi:hypothetical protein